MRILPPARIDNSKHPQQQKYEWYITTISPTSVGKAEEAEEGKIWKTFNRV